MRKVKEDEKKEKKMGLGMVVTQGCFKRVERKKTYSFHLVVGSLSIALFGEYESCLLEGRVELAVASVPTGHSWDWD